MFQLSRDSETRRRQLNALEKKLWRALERSRSDLLVDGWVRRVLDAIRREKKK